MAPRRGCNTRRVHIGRGERATISDSPNGFFVLTHTCPATGTPSPSPSGSSPSDTPSPSDSSTNRSETSSSALSQVVLFLGSGLAGGMSLLQYARRRRDEA